MALSGLLMTNTPFLLSPAQLKDELAFLRDNWSHEARPLMCLLITENMVTGDSFPDLLEFMASLKQGECNGVTVCVHGWWWCAVL